MRWIKLDESIINWEWFQDGNTLKLWIYLLVRANYKDVKHMGMTLRRGQHIVATRRMADDLSVSQNTILRSLNILVESQCIVIENLGKMGSLITVVNYEKYQKDSADNEQDDSFASNFESQTESETESQTDARNRIEKEINKEKESVSFARTWEAELVGDEIWKEQLAMRLHVSEGIVVKGIHEAAETFLLDNQIPPDRQNYRLRTRQYIDSHLATIIRPTADKVNEQINRENNYKNKQNYDTGNQIDDQTRRLQKAILSGYASIGGGAGAGGNTGLSGIPEGLFG